MFYLRAEYPGDVDDDEKRKKKRCADSMIDSLQLVGNLLCGDDVNVGSERACRLQLNSRPTTHDPT